MLTNEQRLAMQEYRASFPVEYTAPKSATLPSDNSIVIFKAYGAILSQPQYMTIREIENDCCAAVRVAGAHMEIFASQRNADLTTLTKEVFINISALPSTDDTNRQQPKHAPILLALFNQLPDAKYIFWSDKACLEGQPTSRRISQKYPTVSSNRLLKAAQPDTESNFTVNIKGGGFIVVASNLEFLERQVTKIRPAYAPHL